MNKKILIAAGGTGGHVFPGLALADELASRTVGVDIAFVGTDRGLEKDLVPANGYSLTCLRVGRIKGEKSLSKILAYATLPFAIARAMAVIVKESPELVVSVGGYAAGPISVAAWMKRIPVVVLEPNAIPGFTNRMIAKFATRICVAFDNATKNFDAARVVNTGVPVRKEIFMLAGKDKPVHEKFTVLVIGGSQGSRKLNESVSRSAALLSDIAGKVKFIHQTGRDESSRYVEAAYRGAGVECRVFEFCEKIWDVYPEADFAISRSGASAVAELQSLAIPSVLVPYPFAADDHQRANAAELASKGGAVVVADNEFTPERAAAVIREMVENKDGFEKMREALKKMKAADAARRIADICMGILG